MRKFLIALTIIVAGCGANTPRPKPQTVYNAACRGAKTACRVVEQVCNDDSND